MPPRLPPQFRDRFLHVLDRRRIDQRIDVHVVAPAPAQGALAVQALRANRTLLGALAVIDRPEIRLAVEAEREVLAATGGTCRAPVGAFAILRKDDFEMVVGGVNSDGSDLKVESIRGLRRDSRELAREAGRMLARAVTLR